MYYIIYVCVLGYDFKQICFIHADFGKHGMEQNNEMLASIKFLQLTDVIVTLLMMYGVIYVSY